MSGRTAPIALLMMVLVVTFWRPSPALSDECFGDIATVASTYDIGLTTKAEIRANVRGYEYGDRKFFYILNNKLIAGWIYGTQHSTYPDVAYISPLVHNALSASDIVVTETDILDSATRNRDTLRTLILRTGGDVPIGEAVFNKADAISGGKISAILLGTNMSMKTAYGTPPRALMTRLLNYGCQNPIMNVFASASTLDDLVQSWSIALSKPMLGLESADSVYTLLVGREYNEYVTQILPLLARRASIGATLQNFRNAAYAAGRIDFSVAADLAYLATQSERNSLYAKQNFLTEKRNQDFSKKILSVLGTRKRPFIAIGAAHLLGQKGVLGTLTQAGYEILPIPLELEEQTRMRLPIFNGLDN